MVTALIAILCAPALAQSNSPSLDDLQPMPEDPPSFPTPPPAEELVGMTYKKFKSVYGAPSATYQMSHRLDAYAGNSVELPFNEFFGHGAWRTHAMTWKSYVDTDFSFNPTAVAQSVMDVGTNVQGGNFYPTNAPNCDTSFWVADDYMLNEVELDTNVFVPNTAQTDPRGSWMCHTETDPAVGMVFAALVMHYWNSPVYINALYDYPTPHQGTQTHTAGLELITFSQDLHTACGLSTSATAQSVLSSPLTCSSALVLNSADLTVWNDHYPPPPGNTIVPYENHKSFSGTAVHNAWINAPLVGDMVFDPPEDGNHEEDLAGLRVLAEALADQVMVVDGEGTLVRLRDL